MLKKLELNNFKSHHHTQFDFNDSRLQAIIGQNSSGKTSVLQSLYWLSQLSKVTNLKDKILYDQIFDIGFNNGTVDQSKMLVIGSGYWEDDSQETWKFSGEERNPKLVVKQLTGGDSSREQQCWEETDLEILRSRGANTGLTNYLNEVEQRLISILDRSDL
jgi:AAA15 family ATPase/GTPase